MNGFHRHLLQHRLLFAWLAALALAMKLLVPAGFMPVVSASSITIEICAGYEPQEITAAHGTTGKHHHQDHQSNARAPCPFAALSAPSLAGADPIQLVSAIVFVMALGFLSTPPILVCASARLRPPLRGPPLLA